MSRVAITCEELNLRVSAYMAQDPPTITGGLGGWTSQPRPRRVSLSIWSGREPFLMTLPILLDGFRRDDSVEADIKALERMALPLGTYKTPPSVRVSYPAPHYDLTWIISETPTFGDTIRRSDGARVRQAIILTLMEFVDADIVQIAGAAARARDNPQGKAERGTYIVKEGDTLVSISVSQLGKASRWGEIADMNGLRDGERLNEGDILRIP